MFLGKAYKKIKNKLILSFPGLIRESIDCRVEHDNDKRSLVINNTKSSYLAWKYGTLPKEKNRAFTLIELLVVISIIALLSSVVLSSLNSARKKAEVAKFDTEFLQIRTAIELYRTDNNGNYPPSAIVTYSNNNPNNPNYPEISGVVSELNSLGYLPAESIDVPSNFYLGEVYPTTELSCGSADPGGSKYALYIEYNSDNSLSNLPVMYYDGQSTLDWEYSPFYHCIEI